MEAMETMMQMDNNEIQQDWRFGRDDGEIGFPEEDDIGDDNNEEDDDETSLDRSATLPLLLPPAAPPPSTSSSRMEVDDNAMMVDEDDGNTDGESEVKSEATIPFSNVEETTSYESKLMVKYGEDDENGGHGIELDTECLENANESGIVVVEGEEVQGRGELTHEDLEIDESKKKDEEDDEYAREEERNRPVEFAASNTRGEYIPNRSDPNDTTTTSTLMILSAAAEYEKIDRESAEAEEVGGEEHHHSPPTTTHPEIKVSIAFPHEEGEEEREGEAGGNEPRPRDDDVDHTLLPNRTPASHHISDEEVDKVMREVSEIERNEARQRTKTPPISVWIHKPRFTNNLFTWANDTVPSSKTSPSSSLTTFRPTTQGNVLGSVDDDDILSM